METLKQSIGAVLAIVLIGGCLFMLYAIVRYSIIAPFRTRDSRGRLRTPVPDGIEPLVGFAPDAALLRFYREWPHLERTEYFLVDPKTDAAWFIGGFDPLARVDVAEKKNVVPGPGLPIADALESGTYFLLADGSIHFQELGARTRKKVADSIAELATFVPKRHEDMPDYEE